MAQAKRKMKQREARKKSDREGYGLTGFGLLIGGMLIGCLGTLLWQGTQTPDGGLGAGIGDMMKQSRENQDDKSTTQAVISQQPIKQQTSFDFFTVLPEIEVVVPDIPAENSVAAAETGVAVAKKSAQVDGIKVKEIVVQDLSSYMLQAGSFQRQADADQLKAQLALWGHSSVIQKVTIQGRGDFYRVRLGPFKTHAAMVKVDGRLIDNGVKPLRLKVSRGG